MPPYFRPGARVFCWPRNTCFPLSLRKVEDLLGERGIDTSHEIVCDGWNRFGPLMAREIKKRRFQPLGQLIRWCWRRDAVIMKIKGETHSLWPAVNHEGAVLEPYVTRTRDKASVLAPARAFCA